MRAERGQDTERSCQLDNEKHIVLRENDEEIETVEKHCRHKDCVYRYTIMSGMIPICYYAVVEGHVRGCSISKCDKYTAGERKAPKMDEQNYIYWELDLYEDDNSVW